MRRKDTSNINVGSTYRLHDDEIAALDEPLTGDGGFQSLFLKLRHQLKRDTNEITLTDALIVRVRNYLDRYGQGGYQNRLKKALGRVLGL